MKFINPRGGNSALALTERLLPERLLTERLLTERGVAWPEEGTPLTEKAGPKARSVDILHCDSISVERTAVSEEKPKTRVLLSFGV
jgi:hypothetical protein